MTDEEMKYWLTIWKIIAVCFCMFVLTLGSCSTYQTHAKTELIKSGADPMEILCAMGGTDGRQAICTAIAMRPRGEK